MRVEEENMSFWVLKNVQGKREEWNEESVKCMLKVECAISLLPSFSSLVEVNKYTHTHQASDTNNQRKERRTRRKWNPGESDFLFSVSEEQKWSRKLVACLLQGFLHPSVLFVSHASVQHPIRRKFVCLNLSSPFWIERLFSQRGVQPRKREWFWIHLFLLPFFCVAVSRPLTSRPEGKNCFHERNKR